MKITYRNYFCIILFLSTNCVYSAAELPRITTKAYPLHQAARHGDLDTLKSLDTQDLNEQDVQGKTPLHYAVQYNQLEVVRHLLSLGTSRVHLHVRDVNNQTPLMLAEMYQHVDISRAIMLAYHGNPIMLTYLTAEQVEQCEYMKALVLRSSPHTQPLRPIRSAAVENALDTYQLPNILSQRAQNAFPTQNSYSRSPSQRLDTPTRVLPQILRPSICVRRATCIKRTLFGLYITSIIGVFTATTVYLFKK